MNLDALVAAVAVAAGGVAQAVTGIGFSLVCAPFLVATHGPREGVRLALVLSLLVNVAGLARERHQVRLRAAAVLLGAAVLATPVLAIGVRRAPADALTVAAAVLVLAAAAALWRGLQFRAARGRAGAMVAGVVSAAMNLLASISGPAAVLYMANAGWPAASARATLQAYFFVLNVVGLASLGLPAFRPVLFVALAAGWGIGLAADRVVPDESARRATLALAAVGALVAAAQALR